MSFINDHLKHVGYNHSNGPAVYTYKTNDVLASMLVAGYFDDPRHDLEVGDIIHAYCSDYATALQYLGNDSCYILSAKNTYWFDDNDAATGVTPISHTGHATDTYLTNDSAGGFSDAYDPHGHSSLWNTSTNKFDFSGLSENDIVCIRVDAEVTTSANNQEFQFLWSLAEATASAFELTMFHAHYKDSGVKPVSFVYEVYMGGANILSGPSRIRFVSEDNASIRVNGWYTRIIEV